MKKHTKDGWIRELNLKEHPEGGYFSEVYRSKGIFSGSEGSFPGQRNFSTAIYYLLGSNQVSRFHRIRSDEIWHHYAGASAVIHTIDDNGSSFTLKLGKQIGRGEKPMCIVPAGVWFGVMVEKSPEHDFVLCGCTVSPGFDFKDFEMADQKTLLHRFPLHASTIKKLA